MHRVRVGLTGLACVFLLVMLATAFLGAGRDATVNTTLENQAEPNEPLAELGVAPGNPEPEPAPARLPKR